MEILSKVSVIIPTMPSREALLERLLATIPPECEKIVISGEGLLAKKRNDGARLASREYFLFIDDDNYLKPGAIKEMMDAFDETIGVMGMTACYDDRKMVVADGGSQRSMLTGFTYGRYTNEKLTNPYIYKVYWDGAYSETGYPQKNYPVDEVANAFMIRRDVFEASGGFDEENFPIDLDEADICKRIKDMGYKIVMNPKAICYHKSQTYSHIPDFRRPLNAYFMGRNRVLFQRKHNSALCYGLYLAFFMPVFVGFYVFSLLYRKKPGMIPHFLKGVFDGLRGCRKNQYQA